MKQAKDPSILTKDRLKTILTSNGIALPDGDQRRRSTGNLDQDLQIFRREVVIHIVQRLRNVVALDIVDTRHEQCRQHVRIF